MSVVDLLADLQERDIKIWIEEDELRYSAPPNGFSSDLRQEVSSRKAEIVRFLQQTTHGDDAQQSIVPVDRADDLPLSFAEERLWFIHQLQPDIPIYNLSQTYRLNGPLNEQALQESIGELLRRHESLRTTFRTQNRKAVRVIADVKPFSLFVTDLRDVPDSQKQAEVTQWVAKESAKPFELEDGPLFRVKLLRLASEEHILMMTMHHIISDGWSAGVLRSELAALYTAYCQNQSSPLSELPIQYADFAYWQRLRQTEILSHQLGYWKNLLQDAPPLLELPTDRPRPPRPSHQGASVSCTLDFALTEDLDSLCQQEGATLFMTLLTAFKILLFRYSAQEDIVVGTPIANRTMSEIEGLIGFFVNTLVVRTNLSDNPAFSQLLKQVRTVTLDAYEHQELPFEKLVEELQPERTLSHHPLFQVMFVMQNASQQTFSLPNLAVSRVSKKQQNAKFDLTITISKHQGKLHISFNYNRDIFDASTIERMAGHFQTLLQGIVANPLAPISDLPMLTEAERHQLLVDWNDTTTSYPYDQCVHQLFEAQVEESPHAIALLFGKHKLTYRELNVRANQLAHYLIKEGVGPETLVGICVERSLEMVIGLLAILKAGGAYVPLDPSYPKERLDFMIADSKVSILLIQGHLQNRVPPTMLSTILVDEFSRSVINQDAAPLIDNPTVDVSAQNLIYITYTSGSTGRSKGTMIEHRGAVRLVKNIDYASLTPNEVLLQLAPLSFDASTFEIWGALLNGARLAIMPPTTPSLAELATALKHHQVTTLWLTAGLFHLMVEQELEALKNVHQLLAGGDVLSVQHVQKLLSDYSGTLINGYGPTENTTFTCCYRMNHKTQIDSTVPIGHPITNTQVYILDDMLKPVPMGVPGTLYIGGDGLARGYLNQLALTEERFIPNPFSPGNRLYNSGDQARYLSTSSGGPPIIEFLGRKDHQVKIRGFRVELGEIENVLAEYTEIQNQVVITYQRSTGNELVAYYVSKDALANDKLLRFLQRKLPAYMIPSTFIHLEKLPLTTNGKIDRQALPLPEKTTPPAQMSQPRTFQEEMLSRIWVDVLGLNVYNYGPSKVDIHQNFFAAGGHSLAAVQFISHVEEIFQLRLPLNRLFDYPTIAELAEYLEEAEEQSTTVTHSLRPMRVGGSRPPFFLVPGGGGGEEAFKVYAKWLYLLGAEHPIYGFYARGFESYEAPHDNIFAMAADYVKEMRTLQPEGPYYLGGECIGGKLAFEMGRRLKAEGQEVALLLLMDTTFSPPKRIDKRILPLSYLRFVARELKPCQIDLKRLLSWQEINRYFVSKKKLFLPIVEWLRIMLNPKTEEDRRRRQQNLVSTRYCNLLISHRPTASYAGQITLLFSKYSQLTTTVKDWQSLTTKRVEVVKVPGHHSNYLGEHVQTTAAQVRACLEAAYQACNGVKTCHVRENEKCHIEAEKL